MTRSAPAWSSVLLHDERPNLHWLFPGCPAGPEPVGSRRLVPFQAGFVRRVAVMLGPLRGIARGDRAERHLRQSTLTGRSPFPTHPGDAGTWSTDGLVDVDASRAGARPDDASISHGDAAPMEIMRTADDNDPPITVWLNQLNEGDDEALGRLMPFLYRELHRVARFQTSGAPDGELQPTELIHEAVLRLLGRSAYEYPDRSHFLALAAKAMRRIVMDCARTNRRARLREQALQPPVVQFIEAFEERALDLERLDVALDRLADRDWLMSQVVELRFFGGLSVEETARALGRSVRTVAREWTAARNWLRGELG